MRITSGKYKGLHIKAPRDIRPSLELVRKALFSILGECVNNARFLELFCGSGIIGIEALSLGAKEAIFVDNSKESIKATKININNIIKNQNYQVFFMDTLKFLGYISKKDYKFDIIFLDPPYYKDLVKKTLISLGQYDILTANGVVVCQHFKKDVLPQTSGRLVQARQKIYGDTALTFYTYAKSVISGDV
ncbi:MAG: 16S rRNA (guanine(966)-N(2))-methyltransferase RsmD [Candidatus Omnitrophota bacterium]